MPVTPNIQELRDAFRIPSAVNIIQGRTLHYNGPTTQQRQENFTLSNVDNTDPSLYASSLGTHVYTNIEFMFGEYETQTKGVFKSFGSRTDSPDRLRYEAVLITVNQTKKIVKTEIQGRDGTVKEYIGLDDYQVTVNGIITGENGVRPLDKIYSLKKMMDAPIPIQVASTYLQLLDIHLLVLESYELEEAEGGYSYQRFTLNFISDIPQELELTNL